MGKRKREFLNGQGKKLNTETSRTAAHLKTSQNPKENGPPVQTIQIITGSYNRVLHGFSATFESFELDKQEDNSQPEVSFSDNFLFNAHLSAVRCLALSPPTTEASGLPSKVTLASGSSDERINLYALSANAPSAKEAGQPSMTSLSSVTRQENPRNREIGTLMHHSSTVTRLCFATKSKLLSASEDNTIAVSRARDWTVLSKFKAPNPKVQGRPSGDTAPPGGMPSGVNDFDIHPSMKIMISVGKGERTMRLWNLVTGKKAGTLDFPRDLLQAVGESKYASGEARKVVFSPDGNFFVIGFDCGAVVYNMKSQVQGLALPRPKTKIHQMKFVGGDDSRILAISTDDGRVLFFSCQAFDDFGEGKTPSFLACRALGHLGGPTAGVAGRVKDFEVLPAASKSDKFTVITGGSDGAVRLWRLDVASMMIQVQQNGQAMIENSSSLKESTATPNTSVETSSVGQLIGRYETANRITCIKAFVMLPPTASQEEDDGQSNGLHEDGLEEDEFLGFGSDSEI